ncbi:formimidoylglutamase [Winogradskyella sp. A3E31]|uniref:formimidoylglutamase n=1 Tax=Winogradskyella sp. A3E31 TaxID=3349637 RepID=UPI00398B90C7
MQHLQLFDSKSCKALLKTRKGESKFGEHIHFISDLTNIYDSIKNLDVDYVIFGISEDIGVYANYGNTGTKRAWSATIKFLLNIQANDFTIADRVAILGHLEYPEFYNDFDFNKKRTKKQIKIARQFVETIDADVSRLVYTIVKAGKTPIVIGGGHNNSYGNIKGTALALNSTINVINLDAHSDFRAEEGRHSGNGFSYALAEGFLEKYFIFGLHQNYTSSQLLKSFKKLKNIKYVTFDKLVMKSIPFKSAIEKSHKHIADSPFGIEIDCDAIENVPSSAMTPSGFSVKQVRRFINYFAQQADVQYLHICEASPSEDDEQHVGKLISYLITDFIKANGS